MPPRDANAAISIRSQRTSRCVQNDLDTLPLPAEDNVLKAGSTSAGSSFQNLTVSGFSNTPPDLSAVGENIPDLSGSPVQGTSFAAPQIAGLASYLWLLSDDLRVNQPAQVTRQAILT